MYTDAAARCELQTRVRALHGLRSVFSRRPLLLLLDGRCRCVERSVFSVQAERGAAAGGKETVAVREVRAVGAQEGGQARCPRLWIHRHLNHN